MLLLEWFEQHDDSKSKNRVANLYPNIYLKGSF